MRNFLTGFIMISMCTLVLLSIICTAVDELLMKNNAGALLWLSPMAAMFIIGIIIIFDGMIGR